MKNINHDLIHQLSETLDSIWRYQDYLKNAQGCEQCVKLWERMRAMDEEQAELLAKEIKRHAGEGIFD